MSGRTPVEIILASQSPRRRELLTLIGVKHTVRPADIDETVRPGEQPLPHCERLAREKAERLAARYPDAVVIAADTIVVLDGAILGKPKDATDAQEMLTRLGGRTHLVFTAIAVARGARIESAVEEVAVTFRALTAGAIAEYVETGEPMDKAGAYGIQGYGATIVERIEGDYFSVMGLGLRRVVALCEKLGYSYDFAEGITRSAGA